jgi:hypothetical protein|tara:strand:+ start:756 stop:1502 length:747 start_codon:yes stop_codon:yes gene_type:complete
MERIKKFESFVLSQDFTLDKTTINFIEDQITESQFIEYLNSEVLNEDIIDSLKTFYVKFKEKAFDILMTFIKKASKIGFVIFDKMKTFVNWIVDSLSKWKKDNPQLFKTIIITLLIVILLISSASTAHAQTTGVPVSMANIDLAIGYLKELKSINSGFDNISLMKAMGYLIDMRDGTLDIPLSQFGNEAVSAAKAAMSTTKGMIDDATITKDKALMNKCFSLMDVGSKYIKVIFDKVGNSESIKLVVR